MDARAFELIVITPEENFPDEAGWVNRLFAGGLGTLHLRKPGWEPDMILQYLENIEDRYYGRIMLHGPAEIVERLGLKGVHIRAADLPPEKPSYSVSCSTHNWPQLIDVADLVDYAFISPFFDSISKEGYRANKTLGQVPKEIDRWKAVAMGGIHAANIGGIKEMGLKGAAVLGAVWQAEDPLKAFRQLNEQTGQ